MGMVIPIGDLQITDIVATAGVLSGGKEVTIKVTLPLAMQQMPGGQEKVDVKVSFTNGSAVGKNLEFSLLIKDVPVLSTVPVAFRGAK
jgi:hypothetical protein